MQEDKLIIGLGTGRSGTTSLARFLDAQPDAFVVHEGAYNHVFKYTVGNYLPWNVDLEAFNTWYEGLRKAAGTARMYGDVGLYMLPYVPYILERCPHAKCICMRRDKQQVIDSFMHTAPNFTLGSKTDAYGIPNFWSDMHPNMHEPDKEKALSKYWDMYYAQAAEYEQKYPESFKVFDIDQLNTQEGKHAILDFAGVPRSARNLSVNTHINKRYPRWLTYIALTVFNFFTMSWGRIQKYARAAWRTIPSR